MRETESENDRVIETEDQLLCQAQMSKKSNTQTSMAIKNLSQISRDIHEERIALLISKRT